ncbi:hypothetical protein BKA82DRAFT_29599 [Pisolithus tinctorius]|uniref:Uncharacterized protein n=1 Tax=Pisolithus tinctorius Marx 270 TaxID=870435 RepID=A0A0C3NYV7_PISTI|nr:hypothetical protein BKA82DRAFT_29599 [Pisolithus tinctorius]KIO00461.1 hypothetical protein M404DRAFT_29599 [Pisolithus tinctorius Marx 270]
MDPHENLMNRFLNEWEPTAPPVDGMNMDLLEQLLNAWEPSALPVTDKKLNRMDGSSTPAQDMTMQVDFLADLQNVWEPSPLPITCESSNLRDPSPRPNSPTNLLAQLQDMREPTPPLLVSNVPVESFDLTADEDNGGNHLTFGMLEQSEMRDLFEEICNEMGIVYLVCQIEVASVHLKQTADITGWPAHWFANPAMDLNQLNSLILVMVSHASYTPPLPACYHVYLRHQDDEVSFHEQMQLIPLSTFCIIDNISTIIPHWTLHTADPNSSFAFPWWLYHSKEYTADSQRLQGKGLFSAAWVFFKGLWPLPEAPIADRLDGHIKEQVNYCIKNIRKYADVVCSQGRQIDHFYARWWALRGLLGMPLQ